MDFQENDFILGYHWPLDQHEYRLCSELLAFSEIDGSHSRENIAHELFKVLKKYKIQEKVSVHSTKCKNKSDFHDFQTQNLTADNVTVNDKSIHVPRNTLCSQGIPFIAKEQHSQ